MAHLEATAGPFFFSPSSALDDLSLPLASLSLSEAALAQNRDMVLAEFI
jgi:hypothetical protein